MSEEGTLKSRHDTRLKEATPIAKSDNSNYICIVGVLLGFEMVLVW